MIQQIDNWSGPLVVSQSEPGHLLEDYVCAERVGVESSLLEHGAILFRGFDSIDGMHSVAASFFDDLLPYTYRSTPRSNLGRNVYTATEYPRQLWIPQHNENAYQRSWPMRLLFHCVTPAQHGGRTPLASAAAVTRAIDPAVQDEFDRRGVKYVRNYREGVDLRWEEVFGTDSRLAVADFCALHNIAYEWDGDALRTSQICPAFAVHPATGERLWFNQAHLFHVSAQAPQAREMLVALFGEAGLPRNAYFGDGGAISEDALQHIREVYDGHQISFPWQAGDVLLIDNMRITHGREPFEGDRKVLVCMAEPHSPTDRKKLSINIRSDTDNRHV